MENTFLPFCTFVGKTCGFPRCGILADRVKTRISVAITELAGIAGLLDSDKPVLRRARE
jgi:hypothetical protein